MNFEEFATCEFQVTVTLDAEVAVDDPRGEVVVPGELT